MAYKVYVPKQKSDYWDDYWEKSDYQRELGLCKTDGLRLIFDKYLTKEQKILEAGCGLGKWVITLHKKGYHIVGLDNNKYAVQNLRKYDKKIQTKLGDVENMPLSDESYDVYISLGVVEHFENGPQKALLDAFRVLKPGGLAIVEVPFDNGQRILMRNLHRLQVGVKTPVRLAVEALGLREKRILIEREFYEYHYTKGEVAGFMKGAGFEVLEWFPKDDLDPGKSIGLWHDFPQLRKSAKADFRLNVAGKRLKYWYEQLQMGWWYRACIGCVARKPV